MGEASRRKKERRKQRELLCYTDESGNTGNNLFDDQQPVFWTGTIVANRDFATEATRLIREWKARLGVPEMHGSAIGLGGIEQIADEARGLFENYPCTVILTRIEKRAYARLKLADTLLDSGNNKGVGHVHYMSRSLRLPLAHAIVECMTPQDEEEFWPAFQKKNEAGFRAVLVRLRTAIDRRLKDKRTRELLFDAIDWATANPGALLDSAGTFDAPNIAALTMIVGGINRALADSSFRVVKFIHDEQNQFAHAIQTMYEIGRNFAYIPSPTSMMTDLVRVNRFQTSVEFLESTTSPVLQLVDVILWMTKRNVQNLDTLPPKCRLLDQALASVVVPNELSRGALAYETEVSIEALNAIPFSDEQLAEGRRVRDKLETLRIARRDEAPE